MYDLHAHILPGVDDGAKTPQDALEMARVASQDGTRSMLATPHRRDITERSSVPEIQALVDDLNNRIQQGGFELSILLGMENHLDLDLPEEVSAGRALPMNGSRYILVEFPFFGRPNYAEDVLFQLQLQELTPVLAHPERIEAFQKDKDLLTELVGGGALSQITAGSLLGFFGGSVKRFTNALLREGLVHIIASDTHTAGGRRSPVLTAGVRAAAFVGAERARAMAEATPKAVLENLPAQVPPPNEVKLPRRRSRLWPGSWIGRGG